MEGNILIFNLSTSHFSEDINKLFDKYSSNYVLIPPGQTWFLQPLDIRVNKVFKENIYKKYNDFKLSTALEKKVILNNKIDWVSEIWWSEETISINTIKNSFIKSGITNNINQLSTDNIELPKELLILNSIKDEDAEILKKYNLDKGK